MSDSFRSRELSFKLDDAFFRAKYLIQIYALAQEVRPSTLITAFGSSINVKKLQWLITRFEDGDFSALPGIKTSSRAALEGVRSLYATDENVIYLAEDFVAEADKNDLVKALLQEIINAVECSSE
ncbi:MAG: hypothetical protein ACFB16_07330 [Phormidesmis sp.]